MGEGGYGGGGVCVCVWGVVVVVVVVVGVIVTGDLKRVSGTCLKHVFLTCIALDLGLSDPLAQPDGGWGWGWVGMVGMGGWGGGLRWWW